MVTQFSVVKMTVYQDIHEPISVSASADAALFFNAAAHLKSKPVVCHVYTIRFSGYPYRHQPLISSLATLIDDLKHSAILFS